MAEGGAREAVDAKIKAWERELEQLRVVLANASDAVHDAHHEGFVELYRQKEVFKSRWEILRGTYQPDPTAVAGCEEALAAMEAAWERAQPMRAAVLQSPGNPS